MLSNWHVVYSILEVRVREMERKRVGHIHSVSQCTELEPACQVHPEFYLKFKLERFNYFVIMKVRYVIN